MKPGIDSLITDLRAILDAGHPEAEANLIWIRECAQNCSLRHMREVQVVDHIARELGAKWRWSPGRIAFQREAPNGA